MGRRPKLFQHFRVRVRSRIGSGRRSALVHKIMLVHACVLLEGANVV